MEFSTVHANADTSTKTLRRSIFISHSSADFKIADEVRQLLEDHGISCWIAPRDIPASSSYGSEISKALDECSVTVLILTEQSNLSRPVANELELSFSKQKTIIPLRLREVKPSRMLEFYVSNAQWIDAYYSPLKQRILEIIKIVQAVESGIPPSSPAPEKKSLIGRIERFLEQALRHKILATLLALSVILFVAGAAALNAHKIQAAVDADKQVISQDPSTLGLITLSASPSLGSPQVDANLSITASVYLNVKGATFKDAQVFATVETGDAQALTLNLSDLLDLDKGADTQTGTFQVPAAVKKIIVCVATKHPTEMVDYTAIWSYTIRHKQETINVIRDRVPKLIRGVPSICQD